MKCFFCGEDLILGDEYTREAGNLTLDCDVSDILKREENEKPRTKTKSGR